MMATPPDSQVDLGAATHGVPDGFERMPPFGPFHELVGPIYFKRTDEGFSIGLLAE